MTISPISPNRAARRSLARRGGALGAGGVLVAGSAAALLTALAGSAGAAATITVDSNVDGAADATHCTDGTIGNCTLRDAAAATADGDTIVFDPSISSITLTNGQIEMGTANVVGPGASSLTVTTTAAANSYNIFRFSGAGVATISGLTLTKNRIQAVNYGNFTVDDVTVSGSGGGYGGALYASNGGNLVISGSHFDNNFIVNGYASHGGAIYSHNGGAVTISDSEFIDNDAQSNGTGGGIFVSTNATSFSLTNSVVTGNSAQFGGGMDIGTAGTVMIADSDISSNTTVSSGAGALIGGAGAVVSIERSTFDGNVASTFGDGGGLKISNRSLVVSSSTISNNVAENCGGGIGIYRGEYVTINNSTIAGNQSRLGGGLYVSHMPVEINQSTITNNDATDEGGGVRLYVYSMDVSGTIISGNTSGTAGLEDVATLYVTAINSDHSIVGTVAEIGLIGTISVTDLGGTIRSSTPGLLALADNGGLTKTMALDPTSIAIDAGPDPVATFTGNEFDQRGDGFDRVSNGTVDIGAFELQADPPPTSSTTSSSTTSTTAPPNSSTTVVIDPTTTVAVDPMVPEFTG